MIGIGPNNPNNENDFYEKTWSYDCYTSKLVLLGDYYDKYSQKFGKLKKGDIVELYVDRTEGKFSFSINDSDYFTACSNIPEKVTLYPIVIIRDQNMTVEII